MLEELGSIQSRIAEIQSRLDALSPAPVEGKAGAFSDTLRLAQEETTPSALNSKEEGVSTHLLHGEAVQVTPAALGPLPTNLAPMPISPANVVPLQTGAADMNSLAETYAARHGLPTALVKAVIQTESGGNPRAVSRAGAMGLMQLMPANVKEAGISDPFDPEQNIAAGTAQLAGLMQQYGGDIDLALAGYNAGPGNVKKWGVPPFRETQNYIHRVRALMEKG